MSKTVSITVDLKNPPPASAKVRAELEALAAMPDEDIDKSDIPEFVPGPNAVRGMFYRPIKRSTTIRLDADVLAWLRAKGKGYQTRLNAILREAMLKDATSRKR